MKKSYQFFIWVVIMILGLMVVLIITQINSSRSVDRLVLGNKAAAATFLVNNRLEEMVNLSFELESKILAERPPYTFQNRSGITDTIVKLLNKADQFEKIMKEAGFSASLSKIIALVNGQTTLTSVILSTSDNSLLIESFKGKHFSDSIYSNSLAFQMEMENTLGATLQENNKVAKEVSGLNKVLAITSLVAILILGTIIIRRQVMQFILIRDLEQARKLALQSVKIKDQFLANMSHEIRTPLNALKGFSRLLSKTKLDAEQQQFSSIINSSSESLLEIVNDVLDLSKIEAGAWSIRNKRFSLHTLLKDLELTYTTIANEKQLDFKLLLSDDVDNNLTGDPQRIKQVLMNLISNAIKFTNVGTITLQVSSFNKKDDSVSVEFVVLDTGIGIPDDKLDLIFERFEQLDNSFVRQQGGTGLGLAITKMIIESMGGKIIVNSEQGKGSRFSFTLNFKTGKQPVAATEGPQPELSQVVTDPNCKAILLAEDNKVNQLLVQKMLAPFNIQPVIAENGHQVLQLLKQQHFDLVLMDIQMPLLDGFSTTSIIRKERGKNLPIIGMTAYVQPNEIKKCYESGMNEFIPKPIEELQFLAVLKKYVFLNDALSPESAANAVLPPHDFSFLEKMCNGNKVSMGVIIDTMKQELPKEGKLFEEALLQKDYATLKTITHHLKSTISPLGPDSEIARALNAVDNLFYLEKDSPVLDKTGKHFLIVLKTYLELIKN